MNFGTLPCTGHVPKFMACAGRLGGLDWLRCFGKVALSQTPGTGCCFGVSGHRLRGNLELDLESKADQDIMRKPAVACLCPALEGC